MALLAGLSAANAEQLTINATRGCLESAYATWQPATAAESYNVYYSGEGITDQLVDTQLIRSYGSYYRVDIPGLKAGSYTMKIVPVVGGAETEATVTPAVSVLAHDRSGFAHHNYSDGIGAYNNDGTLKSGAKVLYVYADNAKTIQADVVTNSKGGKTTYTGLQAIIGGYEKGYDSTPLNIRIIGTIRDTDMDAFGSSEEGLQVKGKKNTTPMNITIEGVGDDANIWGFGILVRNALSVELRNFGVMLCMDDAISLDTDNQHIWIHNLDLFYGKTGGDSDQAKGDGTIDIKADSQYITVSYNHFWDSGKSSLCGMTSESGPNWITYHHNWFDHSDSRHPRIRTMSVHVYNNYYDGIAKYGVGATTGSSAFVENNYFRNCKYPMLISMQGTDTKSGTDEKNAPTFSKENGGIIKAYGNVIKGTYTLLPYNASTNPTHFDAYMASSRDEQVPSTVTAYKGGSTYNNFDTESSFYSYTPDDANDVPAIVTAYAGRIDGGDFKWTFDNSVDDASYTVNTALKSALTNYKSSLVAIQGGSVTNNGNDNGGNSGDDNGDNNGGDNGDDNGGDTPDLGSGITHNFTEQGTASSFFTIVGNLSDSKGTVTYNGMTLTQCLKLESSTSIKFTLSAPATMTLVFNSDFSKNVKIDGAKVAVSNGILTVELEAGDHEITKGDTANLYYIAITPKNATGISSAAADVALRFYPNPVADLLYIETSAAVERVEVYNTSGARVATAFSNAPLSLRSLPTGIYIVRVTTDEGTAQQRIIKR